MKTTKTWILLLVLLFSPTLHSASLCTSPCGMEITFPSGGEFIANEAVSITFGSSFSELNLGMTGTINTAVQPETINFSNGGTLELAAGDSITFDNGGTLDIGFSGNLDYSDITIISEGSIYISASSVNNDVHLYNINGTGAIDLDVYGTNIISHGFLNLPGGSISLEADSAITLGETSSIDLNTYAGENIDFSSTLSISVSNILVVNAPTSTTPVFETQPNSIFSVTPDEFSGYVIEITVLVDSGLCTVTTTEPEALCETAAGKIYKYVDGEWVAVEESGLLHPALLLLVFFSIGIFRYRYRRSI